MKGFDIGETESGEKLGYEEKELKNPHVHIDADVGTVFVKGQGLFHSFKNQKFSKNHYISSREQIHDVYGGFTGIDSIIENPSGDNRLGLVVSGFKEGEDRSKIYVGGEELPGQFADNNHTQPFVKDGKLLCLTETSDGLFYIDNLTDEKSIKQIGKYFGVWSPVSYKDGFACLVNDGDSHGLWINGEVKMLHERYSIKGLEVSGDDIVLRVRDSIENEDQLWDGDLQRISKPMTSLEFFEVVDGKDVAVHRDKDTDTFEIIYDGEEVINGIGEVAKGMHMVDGRLVFLAKVWEGGKEVWKEFYVPTGAPEEEKTEIDEELDLLNLVHNPTKEEVQELLDEDGLEESPDDESLRGSLKRSKAFLQGLAKTIKESPREFLNTIAAKKTSAERMLAKQAVEKLLPGVYNLKEENPYAGWGQAMRGFFGGNAGTSESLEPQPGDYLYPRETMGYSGGNPSEQLGNTDVVIESREELRGYISNDLYGQENGGNWSKIYVPIDMKINGPTRENTFTVKPPHMVEEYDSKNQFWRNYSWACSG